MKFKLHKPKNPFHKEVQENVVENKDYLIEATPEWLFIYYRPKIKTFWLRIYPGERKYLLKLFAEIHEAKIDSAPKWNKLLAYIRKIKDRRKKDLEKQKEANKNG